MKKIALSILLFYVISFLFAQEGNKPVNPLHEAVKKGDLKEVKMQVKSWADINSRHGYSNETILMVAAQYGHVSIVEYLIDNGADMELKDNSGRDVMSSACAEGKLRVVKLLLKKGFKIKEQPDGGFSYVNLAGRRGHFGTFKFLIKKTGAKIEDAENKKSLLVNLILHKDKTQRAIKYLIRKGANLNLVGEKDFTPLMAAAYNNHPDIARLLLRKGADINRANDKGDTPLSWAAIKNNLEMVKILVENGADINLVNNRGSSPLFQAAHGGYDEIVAFLLSKGADANPRDTIYGETGLMRAANSGKKKTVQLLIESKADLNMQNKEGMTALMLAARNGHYNVVELLLAAGANTEIKDKKGEAAWQKVRNDNRIIALLNPSLPKKDYHLTKNWFPKAPMEKCRSFENSHLHFCALSLPHPEETNMRRFEITFRDPTRLDPDEPNLHKKKHVLVHKINIETQTGEYMDFELVSIYELSPNTYLIFVPIVSGVPEKYFKGRSILYVFDAIDNTSTWIWTSSSTPETCESMQIQLRYKKGESEKIIHYITTVNGKQETLLFKWDGEKFVDE